MSATPEQIAERLEAKAKQHRFAATQSSLGDGSPYNDAAELFENTAALIRAQAERVRVLALALRRLTYWAQTSGGTAGRDDGLVAAIDVAVEALREHDAALKAAP